MLPSKFAGFLLASIAVMGSAFGQDLPTTGLMLPPLPTPIAQPPAKPRLPGLPGGSTPVFVPISHLTLPDKPAVIELGESSTIEAYGPETSAPDESGVVPPELPLDSGHPLLTPADQTTPLELLPQDGILPGDLLEVAAPENEPSGKPVGEASGSPETETQLDQTQVPGSDLSPLPQQAAETVDPDARGPIFRVRGSEAFAIARQRGFRFSPAQGMGRRDGVHSVASQVPNVLTSEVHGTRMMQMRPSPLWTTPYIENTFYMFCDPAYNAVRLNAGWKIRGIQLKGPDWQWIACPRSGANTASFSIRIRAWKLPTAPSQGTVVMLHGLTLEGPPGATDWKAAFPDLNRPAALSAGR